MVRNHGLHQGIPPERGARCAQTQRCPSIGSRYGSSGGSETLVSPTNPLGFFLLMGILRAVHAHQDLPCEPILRALTHVLPRGKYQLPSVSSPLSLWSIPLIVAIVSMSEPGDIDGKPLVRSLRPAKTVSFELPEVTPPPPRSPPSMHRLPPPSPCRTPLRQPRLLLRLPPSSPHCHFPQPPPPKVPPCRASSNGLTVFRLRKRTRKPADFTFSSMCPAPKTPQPRTSPRFLVRTMGIPLQACRRS